MTHACPCWNLPSGATSFIGRDAGVEKDGVARAYNAIGPYRSEGPIDLGIPAT
jgi:hypothetical protein